jgi:hypothetical protein
MAKKPSHYVVVHNQVVNYPQGAVLATSDIEHLDHLLAAGAIREATDEEVANAGRMDLGTALRHPSPAGSLTNMPMADVDPQVARNLMGHEADAANVVTARTVDADAKEMERDQHESARELRSKD